MQFCCGVLLFVLRDRIPDHQWLVRASTCPDMPPSSVMKTATSQGMWGCRPAFDQPSSIHRGIHRRWSLGNLVPQAPYDASNAGLCWCCALCPPPLIQSPSCPLPHPNRRHPGPAAQGWQSMLACAGAVPWACLTDLCPSDRAAPSPPPPCPQTQPQHPPQQTPLWPRCTRLPLLLVMPLLAAAHVLLLWRRSGLLRSTCTPGRAQRCNVYPAATPSR